MPHVKPIPDDMPALTPHLVCDDAAAAIDFYTQAFGAVEAMRLSAAGAKVTMPLANMFWGDRYGQIEDPFGHRWSIATHLEDLTPGQIQANFAALPPREGCGS